MQENIAVDAKSSEYLLDGWNYSKVNKNMLVSSQTLEWPLSGSFTVRNSLIGATLWVSTRSAYVTVLLTMEQGYLSDQETFWTASFDIFVASSVAMRSMQPKDQLYYSQWRNKRASVQSKYHKDITVPSHSLFIYSHSLTSHTVHALCVHHLDILFLNCIRHFSHVTDISAKSDSKNNLSVAASATDVSICDFKMNS